jgi:hypothetical protein
MRASLWIRAVLFVSVVFMVWASGSRAADNQRPIDASSFRCMTSMTPVRQFYVDNLRGDLQGTLAAANSPTGARVSAGLSHSARAGRGDGEARQGLQRGDARLGVLRARRVKGRHADSKARLRGRRESHRSPSPGRPVISGRSGEPSPACCSSANSRFAPWSAARTTGHQPCGPPGPRWWSATCSRGTGCDLWSAAPERITAARRVMKSTFVGS